MFKTYVLLSQDDKIVTVDGLTIIVPATDHGLHSLRGFVDSNSADKDIINCRIALLEEVEYE